MALTLTNLRLLLQTELRDPFAQRFQVEDLDYGLNQAYRKTFLHITNSVEDYFVLPATVNIVPLQRLYPLPTNHLRTKMVEIYFQNKTTPLMRRRRGVAPNYTQGVGISVGGWFPYFDFEGDNLVLEPTPRMSITNGLIHTYYPTTTNLVNPSDTIIAGYKDIFVDYLILEAALVCLSTTEAIGAIVSKDRIGDRIKRVEKEIERTLMIRALSPVQRRKKGYFK